jgi:hypothetical protein
MQIILGEEVALSKLTDGKHKEACDAAHAHQTKCYT